MLQLVTNLIHLTIIFFISFDRQMASTNHQTVVAAQGVFHDCLSTVFVSQYQPSTHGSHLGQISSNTHRSLHNSTTCNKLHMPSAIKNKIKLQTLNLLLIFLCSMISR